MMVDDCFFVKYNFIPLLDDFMPDLSVISDGETFIKSPDLVAVGQPVTVYIAVKKKGKIKKLNGRVTWSNRIGFGVKFGRSD